MKSLFSSILFTVMLIGHPAMVVEAADECGPKIDVRSATRLGGELTTVTCAEIGGGIYSDPLKLNKFCQCQQRSNYQFDEALFQETVASLEYRYKETQFEEFMEELNEYSVFNSLYDAIAPESEKRRKVDSCQMEIPKNCPALPVLDKFYAQPICDSRDLAACMDKFARRDLLFFTRDEKRAQAMVDLRKFMGDQKSQKKIFDRSTKNFFQLLQSMRMDPNSDKFEAFKRYLGKLGDIHHEVMTNEMLRVISDDLLQVPLPQGATAPEQLFAITNAWLGSEEVQHLQTEAEFQNFLMERSAEIAPKKCQRWQSVLGEMCRQFDANYFQYDLDFFAPSNVARLQKLKERWFRRIESKSSDPAEVALQKADKERLMNLFLCAARDGRYRLDPRPAERKEQAEAMKKQFEHAIKPAAVADFAKDYQQTFKDLLPNPNTLPLPPQSQMGAPRGAGDAASATSTANTSSATSSTSAQSATAYAGTNAAPAAGISGSPASPSGRDGMAATGADSAERLSGARARDEVSSYILPKSSPNESTKQAISSFVPQNESAPREIKRDPQHENGQKDQRVATNGDAPTTPAAANAAATVRKGIGSSGGSDGQSGGSGGQSSGSAGSASSGGGDAKSGVEGLSERYNYNEQPIFSSDYLTDLRTRHCGGLQESSAALDECLYQQIQREERLRVGEPFFAKIGEDYFQFIPQLDRDGKVITIKRMKIALDPQKLAQYLRNNQSGRAPAGGVTAATTPANKPPATSASKGRIRLQDLQSLLNAKP